MNFLEKNEMHMKVLVIFWRLIILFMFFMLVISGLMQVPLNLSFLQKLPVFTAGVTLLYTLLLSALVLVTPPVIDFKKHKAFLWYSTFILLAFVAVTYSVALMTTNAFYIDYTKLF